MQIAEGQVDRNTGEVTSRRQVDRNTGEVTCRRQTGIRVKLHTEGHVDRNTEEITYSEFAGQIRYMQTDAGSQEYQ